jgi:N-acetylglucosamine malate deacetylase 1
MAKHAAQGDHVMLVLVADGVTSRTYDPKRPMSRQEELKSNSQAIDRRTKETYQAAMILGLRQEAVCFLNLADQRLDQYLLLEIVKHIENIRDRFLPSVVYTHFWGDLNLDHQIVCRAVLTAFRPKPGGENADVLHFEVPESTYLSVPKRREAFKPNHYVDVKETFPLKLKALASYESERRIYPDFRSVEFIQKLGEKRGQESQLEFAEAFIRLHDPIGDYD